MMSATCGLILALLRSLPYRRLLAVYLSFMISGCATSQLGNGQERNTQQRYMGPRLPLDQVAELRDPFRDRVPQDLGAAGPIHIHSLDGEPIGIGPLEILPGKHRVEVTAYWSNGFFEIIEVDFVATAGKKYLVGGYELKPGQDPAIAKFQVAEKSGIDEKNTFWSYMGKGIIGILALGLPYTWVIVLPAVLVWEHLEKPPQPPGPPEQADSAEASVPKEPPQTRPFEGCCFVWIQDEDTGEVVAGASPKTMKSETACSGSS